MHCLWCIGRFMRGVEMVGKILIAHQRPFSSAGRISLAALACPCFTGVSGELRCARNDRADPSSKLQNGEPGTAEQRQRRQWIQRSAKEARKRCDQCRVMPCVQARSEPHGFTVSGHARGAHARALRLGNLTSAVTARSQVAVCVR